jgi:hypothetical protein
MLPRDGRQGWEADRTMYLLQDYVAKVQRGKRKATVKLGAAFQEVHGTVGEHDESVGRLEQLPNTSFLCLRALICKLQPTLTARYIKLLG